MTENEISSVIEKNFSEGMRIGSGGNCEGVYSYRHNKTRQIVAIKEIVLATEEQKYVFEKEVEFHRILDHPCICHYFGCLVDGMRAFIVMEHDRGETLHCRIEKSALEEGKAKKIFVQLISALKYLHKNCEIVHQDLNPDNILVNGEEMILIDFGWSDFLYKGKRACYGCIQHTAPECFEEGFDETGTVDIWAAGIILYQMLTQKLPYEDSENVEEVRKNILSMDLGSLDSRISETVKDLLTRLLEKDPRKRITIDEIFEHEWLKELRDETLVTYNFDASSELRRDLVGPKDKSDECIFQNINKSLDTIEKKIYIFDSRYDAIRRCRLFKYKELRGVPANFCFHSDEVPRYYSRRIFDELKQY